jgi:hypothetical protein
MARVARQVRRGQLAPQVRAAVAAPLALVREVVLDPSEAKDRRGRSMAQEAVDHPDPVGALVVRVDQAVYLVPVDLPVVVGLRARVAHQEVPDLAAALDHPEAAAQDPLDLNLPVAVDRMVAGPKADREASLVPALNPALNPVLKVEANHRAHLVLPHQVRAEAALVVRDLVDLVQADPYREVNPRVAVTATAQVQADQGLARALVVVQEPVALDREVVVMVLGAAAPRVHQVVAVALATTHGTDRDGVLWLSWIPVHRRLAPYKCCAVALETNRPVPVLTLDKLFTQAAIKESYD